MDFNENDSIPAHNDSSVGNDVRGELMKNQHNIQFVANQLLGHTKPLGSFEQEVLNKTYARSLKSVSSRSNRL
jgi:hypothetical protein